MNDFQALRALLGQATPGEWRITKQVEPQYGSDGYALVIAVERPGLHEMNVVKVCHEDWPLSHADAALIVAAVNNLPELLDEVERLRARTHEIQEEESKRTAKLESEVAQRRIYAEQAREAVADIKADWTNDPPSQERHGFWRYSSENTRQVLTEFAQQLVEREGEVERLRAALEEIDAVPIPNNKGYGDARAIARRALEGP